MDDTGTILFQISTLKDMLDKITREIESEIVKIEEIETALDARESELMKLIYLSQYELSGFIAVTVNSRKSVAALTEEINHQRRKKADLLERLNKKREIFSTACIEFQKNIESEECNRVRSMLLEKESLEDEIQKLDRIDTKFRIPMTAVSDEILEDLHSSNSALAMEIQERQAEHERLLKEIEQFKSVLLSTISDVDDPW
ncbi:uncharacterized protein [Spinacia oleracea]|uniref:Uncharacterized protein isoform X2 n=1 Tax=Spinacia oleracea TaxID=3562 RepID=A0A9R0IIE9_SPIOL|nr:uncharacterized protein LOC110789496 isoform X2 [Spinacia oleracea]